MVDVAIDVSHVTKLYKLYANPRTVLRSLSAFQRKRYKELPCALSDVSFNVKRGECVGIIGTNGSGKSTILKNYNRCPFADRRHCFRQRPHLGAS